MQPVHRRRFDRPDWADAGAGAGAVRIGVGGTVVMRRVVIRGHRSRLGAAGILNEGTLLLEVEKGG